MQNEITLSDGEKVIALLLCDLHKHLKIDGGIDSTLVSSAISGGHLWALRNLIDEHVDDPHNVDEVADILDMWKFVEEDFEKLSKADRKRVKEEAKRFKGIKFPGFDEQKEFPYLHIARLWIDENDGFPHFKGRDLNSHSQLLAAYQRMFKIFEPIRATLIGHGMSADQILEVLNAGE